VYSVAVLARAELALRRHYNGFQHLKSGILTHKLCLAAKLKLVPIYKRSSLYCKSEEKQHCKIVTKTKIF